MNSDAFDRVSKPVDVALPVYLCIGKVPSSAEYLGFTEETDTVIHQDGSVLYISEPGREQSFVLALDLTVPLSEATSALKRANRFATTFNPMDFLKNVQRDIRRAIRAGRDAS